MNRLSDNIIFQTYISFPQIYFIKHLRTKLVKIEFRHMEHFAYVRTPLRVLPFCLILIYYVLSLIWLTFFFKFSQTATSNTAQVQMTASPAPSAPPAEAPVIVKAEEEDQPPPYSAIPPETEPEDPTSTAPTINTSTSPNTTPLSLHKENIPLTNHVNNRYV